MYVQGTIKSVLGYLKGDPQEIAPIVYLKLCKTWQNEQMFFSNIHVLKNLLTKSAPDKKNPEELLRKRLFCFKSKKYNKKKKFSLLIGSIWEGN